MNHKSLGLKSKLKKHPSLPFEGVKPSNIIDNQLEINRLQREIEARSTVKDSLLAEFSDRTVKLVAALKLGEQFEGQITMLLAAVDEIRGFMKRLDGNAVLEREVLTRLKKELG